MLSGKSASEIHAIKTAVVLCTYNGGRYLPAQLKSLLSQTRRPDQIVISDDSSSDITPEIISRFVLIARAAGIDVVFIQQKHNIGFIRNFSVALAAATAELIFLCDQDDVWHDEKIALMESSFRARPELLFLHANARLVDQDLRDLGYSLFDALALERGDLAKIHYGHAFDVLVRRSAATGATCAFRRTLLNAALPVPPGWIHDEWLAITAAALGRVDAIEHPVIDYRQHESNQIGMRRRSFREKWHDLIRPRGAIFQAELLRMDALAAWMRAQEPGVPEARRELVLKRMVHFRARIAISDRPRVLRWPMIAREWSNENYQTHSNGARSLLRDLLRKR